MTPEEYLFWLIEAYRNWRNEYAEMLGIFLCPQNFDKERITINKHLTMNWLKDYKARWEAKFTEEINDVKNKMYENR